MLKTVSYVNCHRPILIFKTDSHLVPRQREIKQKKSRGS